MEYEVIRVIEESKTKDRRIELIRLSNGTIACAKVMKAKSERQWDKFSREIVQISRCSGEDHTLKFIDYCSTINQDGLVVRIITEYCERGNLDKLLKHKQRNNDFYPESELISTFKSLISYFSRLQNLGICHRDIKPENILVTSTGFLKIGDFGSSCVHLNKTSNRTITGSPLYMSPELTKAKNNYNHGGPVRAFYCPFKSDVFSLGLVFLFMTTLTPITGEFRLPIEFATRSLNAIKKIKNCRIRMLISQMIQDKPENRPDFLELDKNAQTIFNDYACVNCWTVVGFNSPKCCNCQVVLHPNCEYGSNNVCYNCGFQLNNTCSRCNTLTNLLSTCQHRLCQNCGINEECVNCRGFQLINTEENKLEVKQVHVGCLNCKKFTLEMTNTKIKHCCNRMFCIICKRKAHLLQRNCRDATESHTILCLCESECYLDPNSLFFKCQWCAFRCYLCFGSMESSHLACAEIVRQNSLN